MIILLVEGTFVLVIISIRMVVDCRMGEHIISLQSLSLTSSSHMPCLDGRVLQILHCIVNALLL